MISVIDGILIIISFIILIRFLLFRSKQTGNSENGYLNSGNLPAKNTIILYSCVFIFFGIGWATLKYSGVAAKGMNINIPSLFDGKKLPEDMQLGAKDFTLLLNSDDNFRSTLMDKIGYEYRSSETLDEGNYKCYSIKRKKEKYGDLFFHLKSRSMILILRYKGDYKHYQDYFNSYDSKKISSDRNEYKISDNCYIADLGEYIDGKGYSFLIEKTTYKTTSE